MLKETRLQNGSLFYQMADTLSSWEMKAETLNDDGSAEAFQRVLLNFWDSLLKLCVLHVDMVAADEKSLVAISCLLQTLHNPESSIKPSKQKTIKIRFTDEDESEKNSECRKPTEVTSNSESEFLADPPHISLLRKQSLEDLVCRLAELSIVYINEQTSDQHLKFLSALLGSFSSNRVFQVLLEQENENTTQAVSHENVKPQHENPSVQFLHQKVITWLKEDWRKETDFLVDILCSILNCCNSSTERKSILDDLTKVCILFHFQRICPND